MWSVWPENVYLYMGSGLALLRLPGQALVRLEHPATLPLPDVFHELSALVDAKKNTNSFSKRPWRISVCLSAVMCPPVFFSVPAGIESWSEYEAIAKSQGAKSWELQPTESDDVVCTLDRSQPGVSAAMLRGAAQQVTSWAKERPGGAILESIMPLWALATQTAMSREKNTLGISVLEPDGLTCLDFRFEATPRAMVWTRPQLAADLQGLRDQEAAWWRSGESNDARQDAVQAAVASAQGKSLVRLGFANRERKTLEGGALDSSQRFGRGPISAWADMWEQIS